MSEQQVELTQREEDQAYLREYLDDVLPEREGFWALLVPWRRIVRWVVLLAFTRASDEALARAADQVDKWDAEDEAGS